MTKISVVISAFNEEKNLPRLLKSLKWADEIIVIDNQSADKTAEIAKSFGAKVFTQPNNLMLNVNKNFGFTKATSDWILNLDADEELSAELEKEIRVAITNKKTNGYWLARQNIIFGKWIKHSLWWPDYQLRLFRKDKGKFPCLHIHEYLEVEGQLDYLKSALIHYNYETVSEFLYKLDKIYTENEVQAFQKSGKKLNWFAAIRFPVEDFLKTFFSQQGYKDGLHGLVLSLLQAFYAEVVFAKIWEKQKFHIEEPKELLPDFIQELKKAGHDLKYWINTVLMAENRFWVTKFFYRLRRRFGL